MAMNRDGSRVAILLLPHLVHLPSLVSHRSVNPGTISFCLFVKHTLPVLTPLFGSLCELRQLAVGCQGLQGSATGAAGWHFRARRAWHQAGLLIPKLQDYNKWLKGLEEGPGVRLAIFRGKQCPRNKKHRSMSCVQAISHHRRPLFDQLQLKSVFSLRYHIFMPLPSAFCKGNTHAKSLKHRKACSPSCTHWAHNQAVVTCPGRGSNRLQHMLTQRHYNTYVLLQQCPSETHYLIMPELILAWPTYWASSAGPIQMTPAQALQERHDFVRRKVVERRKKKKKRNVLHFHWE